MVVFPLHRAAECHIYFALAFNLAKSFLNKLHLHPEQSVVLFLTLQFCTEGLAQPLQVTAPPGHECPGHLEGPHGDLQFPSCLIPGGNWVCLTCSSLTQSRNLLRHSQYLACFHFDLNEQLVNK